MFFGLLKNENAAGRPGGLEKTSASAAELQVPYGIFFSLLPHWQVMTRD